MDHSCKHHKAYISFQSVALNNTTQIHRAMNQIFTKGTALSTENHLTPGQNPHSRAQRQLMDGNCLQHNWNKNVGTPNSVEMIISPLTPHDVMEVKQL